MDVVRWSASLPSGGSGSSAVLTILDVLNRNLQQPVLEAENGLVIGDCFDPSRARIAANLRQVSVDPPIGHPRLRLNAGEPVRQRRDAPLAVFAHMLFADPADRYDPARTVGQAAPEQPLGFENPKRVMPMCSVGENREVLFG